MNYLAHLFLSYGQKEILVGNFVGDFLINKQVKTLTRSLRNGVDLHRKIDSYTDNHPMVRECTSLLHTSQGKYAPVVIDIFFDYILYDNWGHFSKTGFKEFKDSTYKTILEGVYNIPEKASKKAIAMVNGDFLESYTSFEGIAFTLNRMERRLRFPSNLAFAIEDLKEFENEFAERFKIFFPEIIHLAKGWINEYNRM